jgi:hypothetical protein
MTSLHAHVPTCLIGRPRNRPQHQTLPHHRPRSYLWLPLARPLLLVDRQGPPRQGGQDGPVDRSSRRWERPQGVLWVEQDGCGGQGEGEGLERGWAAKRWGALRVALGSLDIVRVGLHVCAAPLPFLSQGVRTDLPGCCPCSPLCILWTAPPVSIFIGHSFYPRDTSNETRKYDDRLHLLSRNRRSNQPARVADRFKHLDSAGTTLAVLEIERREVDGHVLREIRG